MTILFYPDALRHPSKLFYTMQRLGWTATSDPFDHFDAGFFWWYGKTVYEGGDLPVHFDLINEGGVDVRKSKVHRVMKDVFGYSQGETEDAEAIVYKADGQCMRKPVYYHAGEVPDGYVAERLIDTRQGACYVSYRVPVFGSRIPYVLIKYRPAPFYKGPDIKLVLVREPLNLFRPFEIVHLLGVAGAYGTPLAELDVVRARGGMLYVVDVNNVAGTLGGQIDERDRAYMEEAYDRAFKDFIYFETQV